MGSGFDIGRGLEPATQLCRTCVPLVVLMFIQVYLKYQYMPKRYHYANNPWIEDLHLVMDPAWWVGG